MPHRPKPIDEEKLRRVIPAAKSWREVSLKMEMMMSENVYEKLREAADRLKLDVRHLEAARLQRIQNRKRRKDLPPNNGRVWLDRNTLKNKFWADHTHIRECSVCRVGEWQGSFNHLKLVNSDEKAKSGNGTNSKDPKQYVIKCSNCIEAGK